MAPSRPLILGPSGFPIQLPSGGTLLGDGPYALDGLGPSALFCAAGGAQRLQGADASLLNVSSAQKYTTGRSGLLVLNPANAPAYDWSAGRRRLMIEGVAATNLALHSNLYGGDWAFYPSGSFSSTTEIAPDGSATAGLAHLDQSSSYLYQVIIVPVSGLYTFSVWLKGVGTTSLYVYKGDGSPPDNYRTIDLSPAWTRYTIAVPLTANVYNQFGIGRVNGRGTASDVPMWGAQLELGTGPSSLVPTGGAATTRPPDVVTATSGLLSLLQGQAPALGTTLALRGTRLSGVGLLGAQSQGAGIALNAAGTAVTLTDDAGHALAVPSGAPGDAFGLAVAYGPWGRVACLNGGPVVSDAYALFGTSDTAVQFGQSASGPGNLLLDDLAAWGFPGSTAALQAQARLPA